MISTILSLIGNTPLIQLKIAPPHRLFAKLEMYNPTLSIKDRMVDYMIKKAEKQGLLKNNNVIVEATSGNTGAAVALIALQKGYSAVLTTPSKTSAEKIAMMRLYGATVHVCDATAKEEDENHYVTLAKHLANTIPNAYFLDQYNNCANRESHYYSTGPEIWEQTAGKIDYFVAAGSSGGTISGVGRYLKEKNPHIKIILADPVGSGYFSYFKTGKINEKDIKPYRVEGAGKNKINAGIDFSVIDDVMQFTDEQAFCAVKELVSTDGIFAGGSSGGALHIAKELMKQLKNPTNIVTILPDSGMKYSLTR